MSIFSFLKRPTVVMVLDAQELALAWIEKNQNRYDIKGFARVALSSDVLVNSLLCNPIVLYDHIAHFLDMHDLRDPFFYGAISGPGIVEYCVTLSEAGSSLEHFSHNTMGDKRWNMLFLYTTSGGQVVRYYAGIDYALLFQYLLFAQSKLLNMVVLTTPFLAHVAVYKQLHQSYVRQNQFAHDLQATDNDLRKLFTVSTLHSVVRVCTHEVDVERDFLVLHTLFGLLFVQDLTV